MAYIVMAYTVMAPYRYGRLDLRPAVLARDGPLRARHVVRLRLEERHRLPAVHAAHRPQRALVLVLADLPRGDARLAVRARQLAERARRLVLRQRAEPEQ